MASLRLMIITGGSRGIGHFLVQMALREMDVLNISRQPAIVADDASRHQLHNLALDLEQVDLIEPVLSAWLSEHPDYEVPLLILNAAVLNLGWLDEISSAEIEQAFRVNVFAPMMVSRTVLHSGRFSATRSRVAYVVSSLGRPQPALSFAGMGLYSMTKAALGRMALVSARELALTAPHIEVLRIHPGVVDTDIQQTLRNDGRVDPGFGKKTEGLPAYREGDWEGRSPRDHMRTISAEFSAQFVWWAANAPVVSSEEYDFYHSEEFHTARARG